MKKMFVAMLAIFLMMATVESVYAAGVSVQLKRTTPGEVGGKSSEIIFDVVNMDVTSKIEGFLMCRSPDDVLISSSLGAGAGSGAQYISPKFFMNEGPSQNALSLYLDGTTPGEKQVSCIIKYIPYKETKTTVTEGNVTKEVVTKEFILMNANTVDTPTDSDYRELRLDKSVNFEGKAKATPEPTSIPTEQPATGGTAVPKGICGPTALLAIATLPLGIYALVRRRR